MAALAVVTAASGGVGLELARLFAAAGYDLIVTAEDNDIHDVRRDLAASGASVAAAQVDLARGGGPEELWARIRAHREPLTAVALNAAVGPGGTFAGNDLEAELKNVDRNVRSTVHLAKHVVGDMVGRGDGRVLFTTPAGPLDAVAGASRSFVESFALALRDELAGTGVTVTIGSGDQADPVASAREGFEALVAGRPRPGQ